LQKWQLARRKIHNHERPAKKTKKKQDKNVSWGRSPKRNELNRTRKRVSEPGGVGNGEVGGPEGPNKNAGRNVTEWARFCESQGETKLKKKLNSGGDNF